MKLQDELKFVESKMLELSQKCDLQGYTEDLKKSGEYNDFETRLSNDIIHAACGTKYLCSLYDKYGCNDKHITTLAKQAIKCLGLNY